MTTHVIVVLFAVLATCIAQDRGPLWEYVNRPDSAYEWTELISYDQQGFTTYVLNMTSQQWFDETVLDRYIWWHYLSINIPDTLDPNFLGHAFLFVSTGSNDDDVPTPDTRHVKETGNYANNTGIITAALRQIPNQPIRFNGTLVDKVEDGIIAWTWAQFLESNGTVNPEILLRFPMCKAVARGMDTMTALVAQKRPGVDVQAFMVAGESKRGWTTWLMPAVDDRVEAIIPVVLTSLNMNTNMHHYYRSLGNWTFAFTDYYLERIPEYMDSDVVIRMLDLIDPYSYRDQLTVPKLIISGASDEFFFLDDYNYFFDDLVGEKYIWIIENTGHSITGGPLGDEYWTMMETYYIAILKNYARPQFTWSRFVNVDTGEGSIIVTVQDPVTEVIAWMADTPPGVKNRRDFRKEMLSGSASVVNTNVTWNSFPATNLGNGQYVVSFDRPASGYRGFFLKLTFPWLAENRQFILTTKAEVLSFDPINIFPFPDCTGVACQAYLV